MSSFARRAVVLLSGGLDSATTLAMARDDGFACHALSFDYGQRHKYELQAAAKVAKHLGAVEHRMAIIDLRIFGGSALTADIDVPKGGGVACEEPSPQPLSPGQGEGLERTSPQPLSTGQGEGPERPSPQPLSPKQGEGLERPSPQPLSPGQGEGLERPSPQPLSTGQGEGLERTSPQPLSPKQGEGLADVCQQEGDGSSAIPITYVPARNTIFLAYGLAFAEVLDATDIFIGVNAVDYSGYPDCRPAFIAAFETMANLATKIGVEHASANQPAIRIHAPLIHLSKAEIIQRGVRLGVDYSLTHSCYDPDADGRPCGRCDSCRLRAAGFRAAGMADPAG